MLFWIALSPDGGIASAFPAPNPSATEVRDDSDPDLAEFLAHAQQAGANLPRIEQIDFRLAQIDMASVRALRAISNGTDVQDDHSRLAEIEAEAAALRDERTALSE